MKKITAINNAIQESISIIARRRVSALHEPDYNAAIAVELPKLINKSGVFPGVRFGGCYIHQSPKATFVGKYANPSICEVGDLLAICHNVVDGDDRYNAALIQWKKATSGVVKIPKTGLAQLDLYTHWPIFSLNCSRDIFDIQPKTVTPGAQYGLIRPGILTSLFCTIPSVTLRTDDSPSFARFIVNLMKWQTGRPFSLDDKQCIKDSWSNLISHLLLNSLTKHFNRRNVKYENRPRASKDLLQLLVNNKEEDNNDAFQNRTDEMEEDILSILYIEMANEQ